jgi:hypothetical protein
MTYNRVYKNIARTAILSGLGPRRSLLTLPSSEALCVAELLANHTVTRATRQIWVERKPRLRSILEQRRAELRLHDTDIIIDELENIRLEQTFDLVNIDVQCFMTDRLAEWIEGVLADNLMPYASAVFWLMRDFRNNKFIEWCIRYFYYGTLRHQVDIFKGRVGTFDPRIVVPRLLIASALREFDFEWSPSIEYADRVYSMVTVRIDNIRRHHREPIWPRISDLLALHRMNQSEPIPRGRVANPAVVRLHETLADMGLTCHLEFNTWSVRVQSTGKTITEFPNFRTLYETFVTESSTDVRNAS